MNTLLQLSNYLRTSIYIVKRFVRKTKQDILYSIHRLSYEIRVATVYREILSTKPMCAHPDSQIQICSVTSHEDYPMVLLAYKSFFHHTGVNVDYLIFDDGSLLDSDIAIIQSHIGSITIVDKREYDRKVKQYFGIKSPVWVYKDSPYIIKKIGIFLFSSKPKIILMDSDVLFFKTAQEIRKWVAGSYDWFYIQDCLANSYVLSEIEAKELFNLRLTPYVNSGLIGFLRKDFDLAILLKLIDIHAKLSFGRPPQMQVYFSLLLSKIKKRRKILILPRTYLVTEDKKEFTPALVCGHYTRLVREKYISGAKRALSLLG